MMKTGAILMTDRDDGGPAFRTVAGNTVYSYGMTLRDYFAGQALAGILANPHNRHEVTFQQMADDAYRFAFAMLEARK